MKSRLLPRYFRNFESSFFFFFAILKLMLVWIINLCLHFDVVRFKIVRFVKF